MTLETYLRSAAMQGQRDHVLRATVSREEVTCWISRSPSDSRALYLKCRFLA